MSSLEHAGQQVQATQSYPLITRLLLWAGAVGPLLFVVVLLIEGATRPGYSAWHTFGSSLSLSHQGWMRITNFIVCGLLTLGFAIGLRQVLRSGKGSVWEPMLLGLFGLALIIAGIFVTDPGLGYPPGVPTPANPTGHGVVNALAGLFVFILPPIATFVMSRRFAGDPAWCGWALYSLLTGIISTDPCTHRLMVYAQLASNVAVTQPLFCKHQSLSFSSLIGLPYTWLRSEVQQTGMAAKSLTPRSIFPAFDDLSRVVTLGAFRKNAFPRASHRSAPFH